jgi:hypothetical protein
MYRISYKNVLKPGKSAQDFKRWLAMFRPIHHAWGASKIQVSQAHENGKVVCVCDFWVRDLERWNMENAYRSAGGLAPDLDEWIEAGALSMKIVRMPQ